MIPFFFYGTLRNTDVFKSVTGRSLTNYIVQDAILKDHQTYFVESESYPALIEQSNTETEGLLVYIEEEILDFLWRYEGVDDYELKEIHCSVHDERVVNAFIFWPKENLDISRVQWSYQKWLEVIKLDEYLATIPIWMGG